MAWFAGLRIHDLDAQHCTVSVPYKWATKNPFKSTYFAALAMAAELSTGALAMAASLEADHKISMLVVQLEANYFKKATSLTMFTCANGADFKEVIAEAIRTGEGQTLKATASGVNRAGEVIAEFYITWSFKAKTGSANK